MSIARHPSSSRPRLTEAPRRPLLALRGATAESHAGLLPQCAATVRVLDRVYFSVGAGDCIVVQHRDPARVRVLLAALAGLVRPATVAMRGTRVVRAGVRVRRASIRADLVPTLLAAWRSRALPHATRHAPVVHLLRASRHRPSEPVDHQAWSAWAAAQRAAGGALVIVADTEAPGVPLPDVAPRWSVHEAAPAYVTALNDDARTAGAVRAYQFRHGRLAFAPADYWRPSAAPVVLGP